MLFATFEALNATLFILVGSQLVFIAFKLFEYNE